MTVFILYCDLQKLISLEAGQSEKIALKNSTALGLSLLRGLGACLCVQSLGSHFHGSGDRYDQNLFLFYDEYCNFY